MSPRLCFNEAAEKKLIEAAQKIRPLLRKSLPLHEQNGRLTDEVVNSMCEAGLHNMSVPARWKGLNLSSAAMARVAAEIAKGCPSAAWSFSITNSVAWLATQMPDKMQEAVFGNGTPLLTSPQNGAGTITETNGGYLLNGKWAYASNCHHASLALLQGTSAEGQPYLTVAKMSDVKIVNTWKVVGMRGSGSDTIVAENVFIPKDLCCLMQGIGSAEGYSYVKEASDYWVGFPLLRAKAAGILVGAVEGLLEVVAESSERPVIYSSFAKKRDSASFRFLIGEAAAKIRSARTIIDKCNNDNDAAALAARAMSLEERMHSRVEIAAAIKLLNEASSSLMDLAGSSGFAETNLAQQYWRDFNVGSRHVIFNPYVSNEAYGATVLGVAQEILHEMFV
jgi:alkylation response protein AidB-like acyl-CoA dehydrogenase